MQRKGSLSTIPRKGKRLQKKIQYKEAPNMSKWQCGICNSTIQGQRSYCFDCYQALFYYCYINMFFFVEKDDSFKQIYYPSQQPSKSQPILIRKYSEQTEASAYDGEEIDVNWVEDLFIGE